MREKHCRREKEDSSGIRVSAEHGTLPFRPRWLMSFWIRNRKVKLQSKKKRIPFSLKISIKKNKTWMHERIISFMCKTQLRHCKWTRSLQHEHKCTRNPRPCKCHHGARNTVSDPMLTAGSSATVPSSILEMQCTLFSPSERNQPVSAITLILTMETMKNEGRGGGVGM